MSEAPTIPPPGPENRRRMVILLAACLLACGLLGWLVVYPMIHVSNAMASARMAIDRHDLESARNELTAVTNQRPDQAEAQFLLAQTLRRLGQYREAEAALVKAREAGWVPELLEMERRLSRAQIDGPQGDNEKTLQLWIASRHPEDRLLLEGMVRAYRGVFYLNEANRLLGIWINRYPNDWLPYVWRGEIWESFNHFEEARADYDAALQRNPAAAIASLRLANLLLRRKIDLDHAELRFHQYLTVHPDDPIALAGLAKVQWQQARGDEAQDTLRQLFASKPGFVAGQILQATIDLAEGRAAQAIERLRPIEANGNLDPDVLYLLAQAHGKLGQTEQAMTYDARLKQFEADSKEIDTLANAILEQPGDANIRHRIGELFLRLGNPAVGIGWLQSALVINPRHVPTHRVLADYYTRKNDQYMADFHRKAANLSPTP